MIKFIEQKRMSNWVWLIIGPISVLFWILAYIQLIQGTVIGTKPVNDTTMLILFIVVGVLFPLFFFVMKIKVYIMEESLICELWPWYKKKISFHEIESIHISTVNPILDFGGGAFDLNQIYVVGTKRSQELYEQLQARLDQIK